MTTSKDPKLPEDALNFRIRWTIAFGSGTESSEQDGVTTDTKILRNYTLEFTWTLIGAMKTIAVIGAVLGAVIAIKQKYF